MQDTFDVVIRNGTLYDGRGGRPAVGDVALMGDRIAGIGLVGGRGRVEVDAAGLAVAPGFINMLSWATEALLVDGRSQSDIRQGVTLEIFGEGWSMGPLTDAMKRENRERQGDIKYDIAWTTLGEYLDHLVARGVSCNVASFVGATTVRIHVVGYDDRPATPAELARMQELVREAMRDGGLGVGSSLIYTPAIFAPTEELVALAQAAAEVGGTYISHIRNEGAKLLEAIDELIEIARRARTGAEIYHLKQAGRENWGRLDAVIERIEAAHAEGLHVTADMYTYTAGATSLKATMPPWAQEGGHKAWLSRLRDPAVRARVVAEMRQPSEAWENLLMGAGSPDRVLLSSFKSERLKPFQGKTVAEVAALRATSPEDAIVDLVLEDDSSVGAIFFQMSEDNVRRQIQIPWVSFCSDASSVAPEGVFLKSNPHPRAYGTFARLLAKYVREEGLVPLEDAVRRLSWVPARNLGLDRRGLLLPGYFADVVVFDPATIQDHATYERPHRYATGVVHVFVNGVQVLKDGEHTGATPGRVVRGPGWGRRLPEP